MNKNISIVWKHYVDWWLNDLPPLHGVLRFVFYIALFSHALFYSSKDPLFSALYRYSNNDPELFVSYGLIKFLNIPYIDPNYLHIVGRITQLAWVCAAIGLATRLSSIMTATGFTFLHGMFLGPNALNQKWFLPMYALIALCFARTNDCWSVDYHLSKLWNKFTLSSRSTGSVTSIKIIDTGFARKLFLVATGGFYFASGMAKLLTAGHIWHDGHTIQYFSELYQRSSLPLSYLLANHLWLSKLSASIALLLEVGAVTMIFSRKARYIVIPGLIIMHISIKYSMGPDYITNIICLLLLVNWEETLKSIFIYTNRVLKGIKLSSYIPYRRKLNSLKLSTNHLYQTTGTIVGVFLGSTFMILLLVVAQGQIFWWPLTNVYMYSSHFSKSQDIRADYPRIAYYQPDKVQTIAREYLTSNTNIEATQYFAFQVALRLTGKEEEPLYLYDNLGVNDWKQWILTLMRPVLIEDFVTKPIGKIEFDSTNLDYPAQKFLTNYVPILQKYVPEDVWQKYERIEIVYPLDQSVMQGTDQKTFSKGDLLNYKQSEELLDINTIDFVPIASVSI